VTDGNSNGRLGILPLASFLWTVGIAIVGGAMSAMAAFYGLREQLRSEITAGIQAARVEVTQQQKVEMQQYLPLTSYWQWREDTIGKLAQVQRSLDRIEARLQR
jgi:hypothetical protein